MMTGERSGYSVAARIDKQGLSGHARGRVRNQEAAQPRNFFQLHQTAQRGFVNRMAHQIVEIGNAGGRARQDRAGETAWTRIFCGPSSTAI